MLLKFSKELCLLRVLEGHSLNSRILAREALVFCWNLFPRLCQIKGRGELSCPQYFGVWHVVAAQRR